MIKAIVFDCFGVLITAVFDTMVEELRASDPRQARHIDDLLEQLNRGTLDRQQFMDEAGHAFGMNGRELRDHIEGGEARNTQLFSYILELRKHYKTGLLSNISHEAFLRRFSMQELLAYFDAIVLSADIGFVKPEPKAYQITAEKLGVDLQECIMIDDRQVCVDGALAVGMEAILYQTFLQFQAELAAKLNKN